MTGILKDAERIIGYDLRWHPELNKLRLEELPCNVHLIGDLLRPDIKSRLSTDDDIWYKINEVKYNDLCYLAYHQLGWWINIPYESFDYDSSFTNASNTLPDIPKDWIKLDGFPNKDKLTSLIALSYPVDVAQDLSDLGGFETSHISISELHANYWSFLGYDVSDRSLYSCLVCSAEEDIDWDYYGAKLNDNGLFSDRQIADDFCIIADRMVPDHSPFYRIGIWLHPSIKL